MRPEGEYPELQVSESNNALARLQQTGVQLEELLELLYAYGHDLPSLVYDS
jgi:L-ribulose-5-phosphate 3-epimerase UlaE